MAPIRTTSSGILPTCGLSTANRLFGLSEGATLVLSVSVMADRTKATYGDSIVPDEIVSEPADVVSRATAWLTVGS